jgi:small subunit ribosomal protein S27Ae
MGKKEKTKNKAPSKRWGKYKIEGTNLKKEKNCPKCGPGTFLAQHKDRSYCGSCHFVEIKQKQ